MPDTVAADDAPLLLTRQEAVEAFKVSPPTLDKWIRDGGAQFVIENGGNGRPYQIDAGKLKAYLGVRSEEERLAAEKHRERIRQMEFSLTGGATVGESDMTADQRKKLWDEQLTLNKLRRERGELVEVALAERAYERRLQMVAEFLANLPDMLARGLGWKPEETAACGEKVDSFREGLAKMLMEENFLDQ